MNFRLPLLLWLLSFTLLHADFRTETLEQINEVRKQANLTPLVADPNLMSIAQAWADHLASVGGLHHRSLSSLKGYLQQYGWTRMNENLHYASTPTHPAAVVNAWMHSPPHHDNLLRKGITMGGIGVRASDDGLTYVVFNGAD